ncbi:MAG TPA: hypothetical protein VJO32_01850 [Ktedonobacteraceae bacterium]|nr:hypothetical protein [Ktedonobacteraceae bacterium]
MAHIHGVILDVDGTLIDSNDAHAHSWVEAMAAYGYTVAFDYDGPADLLAHYDSSPLVR